MISLEKAQKIVLRHTHSLSIEKVNLVSSLDRVLAEDIVADIYIPGFDRSAMDGFAVRSRDIQGATKRVPVILRVCQDLPAGKTTKRILGKMEAIRIMTGAPIPKGADAVVMVEDTVSTDDSVKVFKAQKPKGNISFRGEDIKKGDFVLRKGSLIEPADIGILAALGRSFVSVTKRPKVAIFSTGDELVRITQSPKLGQIRDTNSYTLYTLTKNAGGVPKIFGIVRDNKDKLLKRFNQAKDQDIIIFSGGVSVGDYDLVKDILLEAEVKLLFWKVAIKPGKPTFLGKLNETLIFGLPGYPVSAMITFSKFVEPAINRMLGKRQIFAPRYTAILASNIKKKPGRKNFIRAQIEFHRGRFRAVPLAVQKSAVLSSMSKANGVIIVPANVRNLKKGAEVEIEFL